MCGIAGIFDPSAADRDRLGATIGAMTRSLAHRGPDDDGTWIEDDLPLALGFRRLSILDLSAAGHQPMIGGEGRFVLTFNGEIYNIAELRAALDPDGAIAWRGHSDTEVLLHALMRWGVEATLPRLDGMYAFAFWDRARRELTLARDPFGEKPLYYGIWNGALAWGSELSALESLGGPRPAPDSRAVELFLAHRYVPAPWSIYAGVSKLQAGHSVTLSIAGAEARPAEILDTARMACHWSAATAAREAAARPFAGSARDAAEALDMVLADTVRSRLAADVPVGCLLSGGIDSSLITAQAARSRAGIPTFCIGFEQADLDESPHARAIATHLGTEHRDRAFRADEVMAVVETLAQRYSEPFADPSALPTLLLSQFAAEFVKVALTGDGGDELFLGYTRYWALEDELHQAREMAPARRLSAGLAARLLRPFDAKRAGRLEGGLEQSLLGALARRSCAWGADGPPMLGRAATPGWRPEDAFPGLTEPEAPSLAEALALVDTMHALPEGLQVKMDRASMAFGLEARAPFLSTRVAAFAWSLPRDIKLGPDTGAGQGKHVLRACLARYVDTALFERPKAGFEPPIAAWLRGPLRDWAGSALSDQTALEALGIDPAAVATAWRQHLGGKNRAGDLWPVLMLGQWHAARAGGPTPARFGTMP